MIESRNLKGKLMILFFIALLTSHSSNNICSVLIGNSRCLSKSYTQTIHSIISCSMHLPSLSFLLANHVGINVEYIFTTPCIMRRSRKWRDLSSMASSIFTWGIHEKQLTHLEKGMPTRSTGYTNNREFPLFTAPIQGLPITCVNTQSKKVRLYPLGRLLYAFIKRSAILIPGTRREVMHEAK